MDALPHRRDPRSAPVRAGGLLLALAALLATGGPRDAGAQELQSGQLLNPLVPGGHVRVGFTPSFTSWDRRWTVDEGGSVVEEPLGSALSTPGGLSLFPGVATLAEELEALAQVPPSSLKLGETRGSVTRDVTRLDFGLHVGVFDWLTVGATLPWVKTRTALELGYRPALDASLGVTPSVTAAQAVTGYLQGLGDAASTAESRAETICSAGGTDCSSAQDLADRTRDFATRAERMYGAAPFFPLEESIPGVFLSAAHEALASALQEAGLSAPGTPVFATEVVDGEAFGQLPERAELGLQGVLPPGEGLWRPGDLELEATVRLLDGEVRDSAGAAPSLAWTVAAGALVRLGTGSPDSVDIFLDHGAGDGQMDVEGFGYAALQMGSRLGLRVLGRYGVQQPTTLPRRIAPDDLVFPPVSTRRTVEWTPGNYLDVTVSPRVQVTGSLALTADYRLYDKGADRYVLVGGGEDGLDPSVLETDTERTFHQVGVGLRYSTLRLWRRGETGSPVQVGARVVRTVDGSATGTPVTTRAELTLRLFRRLWGG